MGEKKERERDETGLQFIKKEGRNSLKLIRDKTRKEGTKEGVKETRRFQGSSKVGILRPYRPSHPLFSKVKRESVGFS